MLHVCTSFDFKYILQGLALHKSLKNNTEGDFLLHILCIDVGCFDALVEQDLPNVKLYLPENDPELRDIHTLPNCNWGTDYANYCWHLVPWFVNKLLNTVIPLNEPLMYCDADIYFYGDPRIITGKVDTRAVGIHTHGFGTEPDPNRETGHYNVGVMVFNRTEVGLAIAGAWKDWVFNPQRALYPKYHTCGDQRWLDLFIPVFGAKNVCVFDEGSIALGHLAPWNVDNTTISGNGAMVRDGKPMPLLFFHFSHFRWDFSQDRWWDHILDVPEWNPSKKADIKKFYEDYYLTIKEQSTCLTL